MVLIVNMIPSFLSGETNQDSEPNLSVNPTNPLQIAGSAFTPDPFGGGNAPIYVSEDGGFTWSLNSIVPSLAGSTSGTGDITLRFSGTTNSMGTTNYLYAGILRRPPIPGAGGSLRLNKLRTDNFLGSVPMTILEDRNYVDQPFIQATTVIGGSDVGKDRMYVGCNDFGPSWPSSVAQTASINQSLDAVVPLPTLTSIVLEARATSGQNGPQVRPAIHASGTVYAVFYGWTSFSGTNTNATIISDVVVVRDDDWGSGPNAYGDLTDSDGLRGKRVRTGVTVNWLVPGLAQERVGGDLSIAASPEDNGIVYVAWADQQAATGYTLHISKSTDFGNTWSADLRTVANAKNPALAVNTHGKVGFLYQQLTGTTPSQKWDTHLEMTSDDFTTIEDLVLVTVPANIPGRIFYPYIGDYDHLLSIGKVFFGIFSAANTPDLANFPNGVSYQRNADFTTKTLFANDGVTTVPVSIDPFFFRVPNGDIITKIEIDVETGSIEGAGTNGRVYLGICGREFRLDKPGDQFRVGILDNFIIGMGSNIENPNGVNDIINSPNSYEIDTYLLNIFPKYIRFEPQDNDDNWNVSQVELRVTDDTNVVHKFDALISNGSIWLGENSGLLLGLS
jgi:hypothetical protein